MMKIANARRAGSLSRIYVLFKRQICLHIMVFPALICLILFCYLPIYGIQIAFKDYKFNRGIWGSEWVGAKYFIEFLTDPNILPAVRNTVCISLLSLIVGTPLPVLFAMGINEITNLRYKKFVQTVSYIPHFISWAILAVMVNSWFSPSTGFVNAALMKIGILKEPYYFLGEPEAFYPLTVLLGLWKEMGWSSIIYLSVIVGVNPELYESSMIDGANIIQRARHITLPAIMPTVMLLLILSIGGLVRGNFDVSYLLGNELNVSRSQIIDTYVYKIGLKLGRYSYATAVGLLSGTVSLALVVGANKLSAVLTNESLF